MIEIFTVITVVGIAISFFVGRAFTATQVMYKIASTPDLLKLTLDTAEKLGTIEKINIEK